MGTTVYTASRAASITSSAQSVTDTTTTNKHPNEWVEYSNSLEDSLTEAENYATAITIESNTDRDQLIADLKEQ